jgi:hypothetical protein
MKHGVSWLTMELGVQYSSLVSDKPTCFMEYKWRIGRTKSKPQVCGNRGGRWSLLHLFAEHHWSQIQGARGFFRDQDGSCWIGSFRIQKLRSTRIYMNLLGIWDEIDLSWWILNFPMHKFSANHS